MRDLGWVLAAGAVVVGVTISATGPTPPRPALTMAHPSSTTELVELEVTVSKDPANAEALATLATEYLGRGAPGIAVAALDRSPEPVRRRAIVLDLRARALTELGAPRAALETQRQALEACASEACGRALWGRGERRARFLEEMVRLGVEDPARDPNGALAAYRLAIREVGLEMNAR